ncbi:hypothetical protein DM02DRAFT_243154 [Periconia macrospinosa]|uniref:Uncharacterized protein n=1 Tax=Periconia macrospinosa TaxID=97972 RepID=A0A2V1D6L8_9PLEO|nr:hypothetical protein DM02DRAFT_243154 [Periconia macrospinosa]
MQSFDYVLVTAAKMSFPNPSIPRHRLLFPPPRFHAFPPCFLTPVMTPNIHLSALPACGLIGDLFEHRDPYACLPYLLYSNHLAAYIRNSTDRYIFRPRISERYLDHHCERLALPSMTWHQCDSAIMEFRYHASSGCIRMGPRMQRLYPRSTNVSRWKRVVLRRVTVPYSEVLSDLFTRIFVDCIMRCGLYASRLSILTCLWRVQLLLISNSVDYPSLS